MTARWRCMVCCNVRTAQSHLDHDCQEHQGPVNDLIYSPFSSSPRHGLDRGQEGEDQGKISCIFHILLLDEMLELAVMLYAMMITNF